MSATQSIIIDPSGDWKVVVQRHIESLNFGSVQIVIQDSRVVEIDKTERLRFAPMRKARAHERASATAPTAALPQSSLPVRSRI